MKDVDLSNKSLADLKYIAQIMGFSDYESLKKQDLIELISGADNTNQSAYSSFELKTDTEEPRKRGRKKKQIVADTPSETYTGETNILETPDLNDTHKPDPDHSESAQTLPEVEPSIILDSADINKNETMENVETPPPVKKRGRPPKKKVPEEVINAVTEPADLQESEITSEVTTEIPVKEENPKEESPKEAPSPTFVIKTGTNKNKKPQYPLNRANKKRDGSNQNTVSSSPDNTGEAPESFDVFEGMLDVLVDGYGFLRSAGYMSGSKDVYVAPLIIKKYNLKTGDKVLGKCKMQKDNEKFQALFEVSAINGLPPEVAMQRKSFETLIPIYPDEKFKLEIAPKELSTRLIDIISPIGKGQRGIIVSPPKAGKTVLLKKIANSITTNYPEVELIVLLIDERPEEVTDMRESIKGDVVSSTFDEVPERHIKVAEMVIERAQRLVEHGRDVVILLDSMTRLARAYNLTIPPTGRTLSGGLDPGALHKPKRFFGSARNIRDGGSLTIISTALVDTGSKMDEVIYEEFKGTGNMELHLDRKLSEKRVFPAIDINKSGTRKEELLLTPTEMNSMWAVRKAMSNLGTADVTEMIVTKLQQTKTNDDFVRSINTSFGSNKN